VFLRDLRGFFIYSSLNYYQLQQLFQLVDQAAEDVAGGFHRRWGGHIYPGGFQ